jgi:hypothetical protein
LLARLLLLLLLLQSVGGAAPEDAAAGVAITNSFGMPSMDSGFLMADIPAAQAALRPGQVRTFTVCGCWQIANRTQVQQQQQHSGYWGCMTGT